MSIYQRGKSKGNHLRFQSTSSTKITDCLLILKKVSSQRVSKVLNEFDKPGQSFKCWLLGCVPEQIKFHNVQKFTIKTGISSSFLFCNVQHVHCNQSKFGVKNVYIQCGLSMMSWSIHTFFVLVDPHPYYCIKMVWIDQNKKGCGSTKTSLTVQAVDWAW